MYEAQANKGLIHAFCVEAMAFVRICPLLFISLVQQAAAQNDRAHHSSRQDAGMLRREAASRVAQLEPQLVSPHRAEVGIDSILELEEEDVVHLDRDRQLRKNLARWEPAGTFENCTNQPAAAEGGLGLEPCDANPTATMTCNCARIHRRRRGSPVDGDLTCCDEVPDGHNNFKCNPVCISASPHSSQSSH
mmetsp:Transcript_2946/g.5354  ORF Transcript_2946/g.5354 Transcript_2946/m.5354 type:complete len:191 (-) Transcript_2946:192-764(-)